jgi:hypothetical protein
MFLLSRDTVIKVVDAHDIYIFEVVHQYLYNEVISLRKSINSYENKGLLD